MTLRDALRELKVPWKESGQSPLVTAGWLGLVCPWCDAGRGNPGLGVHAATRKTSCWRCGRHSLVDALAKLSGRPAREVAALLGGLAPAPRAEERPAGAFRPPPGVGEFLPAHLKYLRARGFDPRELWDRWGVRGIGPGGGKFAWRLFIPVRDELGRDVSWTTRAVGDVEHGLRYRGARREEGLLPRGDCLGGVEHVRTACVVCEGFFDAARVGPGAVWTAGVGYSRAQLLKLSQIPVRVVCFDADPGGRARARQLAAELAPFPGETLVAELSGKDPAEAPESEIRELRTLFLE